MFPLPLAGLALAGRMLAKGLSSSLTQIRTVLLGEDYNAVIKGFIPANSRLLRPRYPLNAREILFADLDGDSHEELITSFRDGKEIKTIILKKQNEQWNKVAELRNSDYDNVKYMGAADITGEGKKQLLLGYTSRGKGPTFYGYSLEDGKLSEMFSQACHGIEVLDRLYDRSRPTKAKLAAWHRLDADTYDVKLLGWNGMQLEPVNNPALYYLQKVVPYYARKVKSMPYSPAKWYNLAEALEKAEAYRDALTAVEVGTELDTNSVFGEKFSTLKKRISEKM